MKKILTVLTLSIILTSIAGCSKTEEDIKDTIISSELVTQEPIIEEDYTQEEVDYISEEIETPKDTEETIVTEEPTLEDKLGVTVEELITGKYNTSTEVEVRTELDAEYGSDKVYAAINYNGDFKVNESGITISSTYDASIPAYEYTTKFEDNAVLDYKSDTLLFKTSNELEYKLYVSNIMDNASNLGIDSSRFTLDSFDADEEFIYIIGTYRLTDKPNTMYDIYLSRLLSLEFEHKGDINNVEAFMTLRFDINTKNLIGVGIEPEVFDEGFSSYDSESGVEYIWLKVISLSFKCK